MSAIIKTIKAKDDNNVEQNIFPKTVLEAVVDTETNETLDVILDNLNEKIDNIEPGGGGGEIPTDVQEQLDGKISKSGDTMTGDLTVKANVNIPLLADNSDSAIVTVPTAGTVDIGSTEQKITDVLTSYKSFMGSIHTKDAWNNIISTRHRNGASDGVSHGMYLRSLMNRSTPDLTWAVQAAGTWQSERAILDSGNYSNYTVPKTGGTFSGGVNANAGINASSPDFPTLNLTRPGVPYYVGLKFNNSRGVLGGFGMAEVNGSLVRFASDLTTKYDLLDVGNYSNYAVPKTGGTFTGDVGFDKGVAFRSVNTMLGDYFVHKMTSGSGSTGYWKFATLNTNGTYIGGYLKLTIDVRGACGDLSIGFNGSPSVDGVAISVIKQTGGLPQIYIIQNGKTFDLYMAKSQWAHATVIRLDYPYYMRERVSITWLDTFVSSLPSGATYATVYNRLTTENYSSYALPLSGGTLTGAVKYGSYNMLEYNSTSTTVSNTNRPNMYFGNDNTRTVLRGQVYINHPGVAPCTQVMWAVISDARLKENIIDLTSTDDIKSKYIQLWDKVNPMEYNLTYNSNKKNLGYVAQDFIEAMEELDIDYEESSIVNIQPNEQIGEDGICSVSENSEYFEELYTLNYDECAMLTTLKVKQIVNEILPNMQAEIDALKEQNELLKEQIRLMKEGN